MKLYYLLITSLIFTACMQTPDTPTAKETLAQKKIIHNKNEAEKAKDTYLELQKQRDNE